MSTGQPRLLRADLHSHAIGDGRFGDTAVGLAAAMVDAAVEIGLDVLAVTDHDDLRPGLLAAEYAARIGAPLLVVPGMEITTDDNHHVLALGIAEPIPRWRPLTTTIELIRQAGALCILPHPFFPELRARRDIDAMERFNARYGDFEIAGNGVPAVANSDAHGSDDLRRSPHHTLIDLPLNGNGNGNGHAHRPAWPEVAAAIRAGRTTAV